MGTNLTALADVGLFGSATGQVAVSRGGNAPTGYSTDLTFAAGVLATVGQHTIDAPTNFAVKHTNTAAGTVMPHVMSCQGALFGTVIDNTWSMGYPVETTAITHPVYTERIENYYYEITQDPVGQLERGSDYQSIDRLTSLRHWSQSIYLSDHSVGFVRSYTRYHRIRGIGTGILDVAPPAVDFDGDTGNLTLGGTGTLMAPFFAGNGSDLINLDAGALSSGTILDARFPAGIVVESGNNRVGIGTSDFTEVVPGVGNTARFAIGGVTGWRQAFASGVMASYDGTRRALFGVRSDLGAYVGSQTAHDLVLMVGGLTAGTIDNATKSLTLASGGLVVSVGGGTFGDSIHGGSNDGCPWWVGNGTGNNVIRGLWFVSGTLTAANATLVKSGTAVNVNSPASGSIALQINSTSMLTISTAGDVQITSGSLDVANFLTGGANMGSPFAIGSPTGNNTFRGLWNVSSPTAANATVLYTNSDGSASLNGPTSAELRVANSAIAKATSGGLAIGAGTPIVQVLSATATLDFGSTPAGTNTDLTITVTGAAVGNSVAIGTPATPDANSSFSGWVSAADTVTVRFSNYSSGAIDPASGTYRVTVLKF